MAFIGGQWVPDASGSGGKGAGSAYYGPSHNGMVWDAGVGGYVSPVDQSATAAKKAQDDAAAKIAAGTAAGTYHAPASQAEQSASDLALRQLAESTRQFDTSSAFEREKAAQAASQAASTLGFSRESLAAQTAAQQAQLAEAMRAAQAGESLSGSSLAEKMREAQTEEGLSREKFEQTRTDRASALAALEKLWGGGGGGGIATGGDPIGGLGIPVTGGGTSQPGPALDGPLYTREETFPPVPGMGGGGGTDLAGDAERAALTGAKEREGERLSASLRGLHELMARRGISGSGIEARNTRDLVAANLAGQAETDRSVIGGRVKRAQDLQDWQRNRAANEADWTRSRTAGTEDWQRSRAASVEDRNFAAQQEATRQKIQALLATFGMTY